MRVVAPAGRFYPALFSVLDLSLRGLGGKKKGKERGKGQPIATRRKVESHTSTSAIPPRVPTFSKATEKREEEEMAAGVAATVVVYLRVAAWRSLSGTGRISEEKKRKGRGGGHARLSLSPFVRGRRSKKEKKRKKKIGMRWRNHSSHVALDISSGSAATGMLIRSMRTRGMVRLFEKGGGGGEEGKWRARVKKARTSISRRGSPTSIVSSARPRGRGGGKGRRRAQEVRDHPSLLRQVLAQRLLP